ncbi:MAG: hypothetical protein F6K30_09770 [Cyanothece sp. SIO2G6]|nr:hypothetical protein [Cyanothece sp. SIO2G6]
MTKYFTHYRTNEEWEDEQKFSEPEGVLNHACSKKFRYMGISKGDWIFIVTILKGKLFLGGKIVVDRICKNRTEAQKIFGCDVDKLSDRNNNQEHLIGESTELGMCSIHVALDMIKELRFFKIEKGRPVITSKLLKLVFEKDKYGSDTDKLDRQTLRGLSGLRQLTEESALLLNNLLEEGYKLSNQNNTTLNNKVVEANQPEQDPPWVRDELILILNLYFQHSQDNLTQNHPKIIEVSEILNSLSIHPESSDQATLRSPGDIYMQLRNFQRFELNDEQSELKSSNSLEEKIWIELSVNKENLNNLAKLIITSGYLNSPQVNVVDEEEEFPEGKIAYREHRRRERNRKLVKKAKQARKSRDGYLRCEVCNFDFHKAYGDVGEDYIECHHTKPVSQLKPHDKTTIRDLALVCANCHRMLHRKRPWLHPLELKEIIRQVQSSSHQ